MLYAGWTRTAKLFSLTGVLPITGISVAWQYLPIPVAGAVMVYDAALFLLGILDPDDLIYSEKEIDFTDEAAADTLVQATFNNNFQKSKKIYGVQAAAVAMPVANEHLGLAINEVAEGKNLSGLACLVTEGTVSATTTAITKSNFDDQVLAERKAVVEAKGTADTVLCSPAFFASMLGWAGAKYIPSTNEKLIAAAAGGQVGSYLGMNWIECNGFATKNAVKYYNYAGDLKTVSAADMNAVDFIMYDHNAFGAGDNFTMARLRDSENFAGTKAQCEDNVAFKVLEPTVVRVRKHAAA